ncbi:acyl-CoA oxidase [Streptomyces kanamyceticus]|uniref:Acyl-CoA oxidase n=1 Tax=Streptomyces kanamyceticus TaxID=1967 RepID=A0A5J6GSR2_STRKN|nr:acyl-CoA oxidase [Streptomyces kanamyceticus]
MLTRPQDSVTRAPATAADDLTRLLFEGAHRSTVHEPWQRLISRQEFRHRADLTPAERTALSYGRLRLLDDAVDSAAELARDPRRLAAMHEWTGVVDGGLGTLAGIHYNLFLGSLIDHDPGPGAGAGAGAGRDLSDFTSMRRTGTFLCTELAHGNDVAALRTTAELDPATGGFILHTPTPGARKFMPNTSATGGPKSAVVAARLLVDGEDQGVFLFLTPLSDETGPLPGVRVRRLPERTGSPVDHCLTSFDRVRLPREALLEGAHGRLGADGTVTGALGNPRKRFLHSISRVTVGKLCMSGAAVGVTRAALAIAVRYAEQRHISGPKAGERVPLNAHRSHHGRLAEALATSYAMTFLHREVTAAWAGHTEEDRASAERLVAVAKGWITWQARDITIECRERCGAQGLFPVNGLADFPLNLEGAITAEGDNLVIWVKAAAEMVFHHQSEPVAPSEVPLLEQELTDLTFLRGLLARTEALWQDRTRTALRRAPAGDPVGRWNAASSSALQMVAAHAGLRATDAFLRAIADAESPEARTLLTSLCRLFLLKRLGEHTGDLLADGHLAAHHVRALPLAVDETTAALAPHLPTLVEAFDLPAEYLAAIPIANGEYVEHTVPDAPWPSPAPLRPSHSVPRPRRPHTVNF